MAPPSPWSFLPFAVLLVVIAVFPLLHGLERFWEKNRNKLLVSLALGAMTLGYYIFWHGGFPAARDALRHAVLGDYVPFIVLLFALYTIAGGIHLAGDLKATPAVNSAFLLAGAVLANFIGTTGASMLLIRPVLGTNLERKHKLHTVIFFIFLVSNIGGCLTPLGDPPLFLGYLRGVPFWWTAGLFRPWALCVGILLALHHFLDQAAYAREEPPDLALDERAVEPLRIQGAANFLWLLGVVVCVAVVVPGRPLPGTAWEPPLFFRELLLLVLTGLSWLTAKDNRAIRARNEFTFGAVAEVAYLFLGIFICMQPCLEYLQGHGGQLGLRSPAGFFWATGALSSFLDNAPTYVVFFQAAQGLEGVPGPPSYPLLAAISMGAVFMGANTYIGNGPNFMVKTIAEKSGVKMPSFFGYLLYSGTILIPLFLLLTFLFLWH